MSRHEKFLVFSPLLYLLLYFTSHCMYTVCCFPSAIYSVLGPIKMAQNIVIKEMLYNPFCAPLQDKLRTVHKGLCAPPLPNITRS